MYNINKKINEKVLFYIISHRRDGYCFLIFSHCVGAGPACLPYETAYRVVPTELAARNLLYSQTALNLYAFVFELFCSLSCLTFHRVKSNKSARHRQNKAQQPFARAVLASTRSAVVCRSQLIVQASGAKELACHALTATRKTPLKHHLPFIRCLNGCSLLFRRCRISFKHYLCLHKIRGY